MTMQNFEVEIVSAPAPLATRDLPTTLIDDDLAALHGFLSNYESSPANTLRAYSKECHRFHLWLKWKIPSNGRPLFPQVTPEYVNAYAQFAGKGPVFPAVFLKANGYEEQPFRKPLSDHSLKHAMSILQKMFSNFRNRLTRDEQPFCKINPCENAAKVRPKKRSDDLTYKALTDEEWGAVLDAIEALPRQTDRDRKHYHRARWIMQLLYRAFLRRNEAATLTMDCFIPGPDGWELLATGKGTEKRIIATTALMDELRLYRTFLGMSPYPLPNETTPAIMAVTGHERGVTAQAIYLICKVIYEKAADLIEPTNGHAALRLRSMSPHTMRHTGVSNSMDAGVSARHVQEQARHSSLNMTARYDHKAKRAWREDFDKL